MRSLILTVACLGPITSVLAAQQVELPQIKVELQDFGDLELKDQDLERKKSPPDCRGKVIVAFVTPNRTESAVAKGLDWLASQQQDDGSWVENPKAKLDQRNLTTAMALLPFLGAGQTHLEGKYKKTVQGGLKFLLAQQKVTDRRASLEDDGGLLSHAIATLAICEAYSMTAQKGLVEPAQQLLNHLIHRQSAMTGGWRNKKGEPLDTVLMAWSLSAIRSAHMAYLQVPPESIKQMTVYLDSVQLDDGSKYGEQPMSDKPDVSATAGALLCRMYLGWKTDRDEIVTGTKWLAEQGFAKSGFLEHRNVAVQEKARSQNDFDRNFFMHQVMFRMGKDFWVKWNPAIRDSLVESQINEGDHKGSWKAAGDDRGDLHATSMSLLTLEVYYRHLPIWRLREFIQ